MPLNQKIAFRILLAALGLQAISVGYYAYFLYWYGYLPSPFVSDKFDTFMDLYNTLWWGAHDGRYTEWHSVYPPLNFTILRLLRAIFVPLGVGSAPLYLRSVNLTPAIVITALYVAGPVFVAAQSTWSGFSRANRSLIALVAILSPVFLFAIERGNLIILPLFLLPFIFADKDGWWKPLLLAIIINLKPYFVLLVFAYAVAGNWRRFLQCLAFAGAIFLLTGLLEDPNFLLFPKNLVGFANSGVLQPRQLLALPASLSALSRAMLFFLNTPPGADPHSSLLSLLPSLIEAFKTGAIVLVLLGLSRGRQTPRPSEAFAVLLLVTMTIGIWAGGYSQIFYLAAVPVFLTMRYCNAYLPLMLAIFLPWDLVTLYSDPLAYGQSFITHKTVMTGWQLGLGSIVRPVLNTLLTIILGIELYMRKAEPLDGIRVGTNGRELLPQWRLLIPAGIAGAIIGAALFHFAISSPTAIAIVRTGADMKQADTHGFLTSLLEHRALPQQITDKFTAPEVATRIANEIGDPGLALQLAGEQYGGQGRLMIRMTGDGSFLEIKASLADRETSLKAATIGANIAMQLDDGLLSAQRAPTGDHLAASWQDSSIVRMASSILSDQIPELRDGASPIEIGPVRKSRVFQTATLAMVMIDSWWLAALIGAIAGGSLGYAIGLSRNRKNTRPAGN